MYLTAREFGWLALYGSGLSWEEIASATYVGAQTIRGHLNGTRRRWGVQSNAALIRAAITAGVLA